MLSSYRTIKENNHREIEIKKSRFICSMKRVTTEKEAKTFIQDLKKNHWKANHNCSAFVISEKNEIQRSCDDGEPSGTAGIPILRVLKKNELSNLVTVVTRYIGGTKLGTGRLIRAYTHAVSSTLKEIGIVKRTLQQKIAVHITYTQLEKLKFYLTLQQFVINNITYTDNVTVDCLIIKEKVPKFKQAVVELLSGQVEFTDKEISYHEQFLTTNEKSN